MPDLFYWTAGLHCTVQFYHASHCMVGSKERQNHTSYKLCIQMQTGPFIRKISNYTIIITKNESFEPSSLEYACVVSIFVNSNDLVCCFLEGFLVLF